MSRKSKGIGAERELIHLFWKTNEWSACRVAGSGSMIYPSPDILAGSGEKKLAIECKACKGDSQYFPLDELASLQAFADRFGAEPWIAIRFDREEWVFVRPEQLEKTPTQYVAKKNVVFSKGLRFEGLVGAKHL